MNVEFKNPLQIPIPVSGVTLICKHFPSTVEEKSGKLRVSIDIVIYMLGFFIFLKFVNQNFVFLTFPLDANCLSIVQMKIFLGGKMIMRVNVKG